MSTGHKASGPTWLGSQRPLARMVGRPVARFLAVETSGGILMVVATIAALTWANSPWSESYTTLWGTEMSIEAGSFHLSMHLSHWVNDALTSDEHTSELQSLMRISFADLCLNKQNTK